MNCLKHPKNPAVALKQILPGLTIGVCIECITDVKKKVKK